MNSNISDLFRKEIVNKLDTILDDVILSRKFEQSLYNYIIKLSLKNNILRNWENDIFKTLYLQKIISFSIQYLMFSSAHSGTENSITTSVLLKSNLSFG